MLISKEEERQRKVILVRQGIPKELIDIWFKLCHALAKVPKNNTYILPMIEALTQTLTIEQQTFLTKWLDLHTSREIVMQEMSPVEIPMEKRPAIKPNNDFMVR